MQLQILKEFFLVALASIIGFVSFKAMNVFCRLIFFQLLSWVVLYILSYVITTYQKAQGLPLDNQWVFNVNLLFESFILFFAAYKWQDSKPLKKIISITYLCFLLAFLFFISQTGFYIFNYNASALESLFLIVVYGIILRQNFYNQTDITTLTAERWICIGLILYFSGNLPYLSFFPIVRQQFPNIGRSLNHIPELLTNVRYLLLSIGFWLIWQNKIKNAPPPSNAA
jgi:hypothetical protein